MASAICGTETSSGKKHLTSLVVEEARQGKEQGWRASVVFPPQGRYSMKNSRLIKAK
jgi:hypothetical protein